MTLETFFGHTWYDMQYLYIYIPSLIYLKTTNIELQIDIDDLDPDFLHEQPPSRMLVLERFDLPQDYGAVIDGWIFTCKSEIINLQALLQCSAANKLRRNLQVY